MRNILKFLIVSILLTSCSASWHLRRAITKDPSIIKTNTVEVTKIIHDKGAAYIVPGRDTIIKDSLITIDLRYDTSGKIRVRWFLKDIKTVEIHNYTKIIPPKTRQQIRQENRTKRVALRQESRLERKKVKATYKNNSNLIYWVIILGIIVLVFIILRVKKLFLL